MNFRQALFYWASTGALLGVGALLVFSVGITLLLLGFGMVLYAFNKRLKPDSIWAALITMGLFPICIMVYQYVMADRSVVFFPDGYLYIMILFGVVAFTGVVWGFMKLRHPITRH